MTQPKRYTVMKRFVQFENKDTNYDAAQMKMMLNTMFGSFRLSLITQTPRQHTYTQARAHARISLYRTILNTHHRCRRYTSIISRFRLDFVRVTRILPVRASPCFGASVVININKNSNCCFHHFVKPIRQGLLTLILIL